LLKTSIYDTSLDTEVAGYVLQNYRKIIIMHSVPSPLLSNVGYSNSGQPPISLSLETSNSIP